MEFNFRYHKQVRVQPSSVTSGETQNYPTSISLHPEVGGGELSSGAASFPSDCNDA